jgi:hypothetical protein
LTPGSSEIGEKFGAGCPQLLASVTIAEEGLLHSDGTARRWLVVGHGMCAESCATTSGEQGSRWANPSFRERSSRGIAGEITELADITRFRAGCPSWCTAVPKAAAAVAPLLPPSCLVLLTLPLPEHHPAASPRHGRPPPPLLCVPTRVDPRHRVDRRKLRLGVVPSAGRARLPLLPFDRHTPAIRTGRPHQKIAGLPRRSDRPKMRARWVVAATPHFDSKLPSRVWTTNHHQVRPAVLLAAPPGTSAWMAKDKVRKKKGARDTSGRVLLRITVNLKAADHAASHA